MLILDQISFLYTVLSVYENEPSFTFRINLLDYDLVCSICCSFFLLQRLQLYVYYLYSLSSTFLDFIDFFYFNFILTIYSLTCLLVFVKVQFNLFLLWQFVMFSLRWIWRFLLFLPDSVHLPRGFVILVRSFFNFYLVLFFFVTVYSSGI